MTIDGRLLIESEIFQRFKLSQILNIDEVLIPWEFLDGCTYGLQGSKTITGKSDQSGWDKRQATLVLFILADRVARIKPKLISMESQTDCLRIRKKRYIIKA
jgi:hypothetical protein